MVAASSKRRALAIAGNFVETPPGSKARDAIPRPDASRFQEQPRAAENRDQAALHAGEYRQYPRRMNPEPPGLRNRRQFATCLLAGSLALTFFSAYRALSVSGASRTSAAISTVVRILLAVSQGLILLDMRRRDRERQVPLPSLHGAEELWTQWQSDLLPFWDPHRPSWMDPG